MSDDEDEFSAFDDDGSDTFGPFKRLSMEVSFLTPDPDLMSLLTGQSAEDWAVKGPQGYALTVYQDVPVRRRAWRVVWEWLTRKPRQYTEHVTYLPDVQVSGNPDGSYAITPTHHNWGAGPFNPAPFNPPESEES